jgi:hypothetical protein
MPRSRAARRASNSVAEMILALKEQSWSTCEPHRLGLSNGASVTTLDRFLRKYDLLGHDQNASPFQECVVTLGKWFRRKPHEAGPLK